MRSVTIYHEVLLSIRRSKHRGRGKLVFESLETFLTFVCPVKLDTFVKQICQRLGNLGEVLDKSAAIAGKAEETFDLFDCHGRGPVKNSLDTFGVDVNAILRNHMTKVGYLG